MLGKWLGLGLVDCQGKLTDDEALYDHSIVLLTSFCAVGVSCIRYVYWFHLGSIRLCLVQQILHFSVEVC